MQGTLATALLGGVLIGIAVSVLWWFNGKIAGVSGILGGLLKPQSSDFTWQLCFVAGLLLAPWLFRLFSELPPIRVEGSFLPYVVAGVLVGFGTRLGSGCTSGHAICGNARFSPRSLLATIIFMICGILTVTVMRHWVG